MKHSFLLLVLCFVGASNHLSAQDVRFNLSISNIEKGGEYCDQLDFDEVHQIETFLYCRAVYAHQFDYRKAYEVMTKAQRKYPYSYEIRLKKALALYELGSANDASKELIGLIKLYPNRVELHNYLGRIHYERDKTKAIMPLLISVSIDPKSKQSEENLIFIKRLFSIKSIHKELKPALDVAGRNDFDVVNEVLTNVHRQDHKKQNEREWLKSRILDLCSALEKTPHQKNGFFWEFYGDYFIQLHKKNLVDSFVSKLLNPNNFEPDEEFIELNDAYGFE